MKQPKYFGLKKGYNYALGCYTKKDNVRRTKHDTEIEDIETSIPPSYKQTVRLIDNMTIDFGFDESYT